MSKTTNFKKMSRDALEGKSFVPHPLELLQSEAWRSRTIHEIRMIERLEIEHLRHGGKDNGHLGVSHWQFVEHGVHNNLVAATAKRLEAVGLLQIMQDGTGGRGAAHVARYRLTYLVARMVDAHGVIYYTRPTDDWKRAPTVPKLRHKVRWNGALKNQKPTRDVESVSTRDVESDLPVSTRDVERVYHS
jgi:hypothetical protein